MTMIGKQKKRQFLAIVLCISMVLVAGCAGWGTDGPADPGPEEETDNSEVQAQEDDDDGSSNETTVEQSADEESGQDGTGDTSTDTDVDSNSQSGSSVNADPSSTSDANADGGSTEVNVNVDNSDSTTVNTESESNAKSSSDSSSDASAASAASGSGNGGSDSTDEQDESTDSTSSSSASDSSSSSMSSSSSSASTSSTSDGSNSTDQEVYSLTVTAGEPEPVEDVDVTIKRHSDGATTTKTTSEDGTVTFDVYGGVYTVTGVDERREEQAKRVTVPEQQSIVLDQLERPVGELQGNYITVVDQNGDTVKGMYIEATTGLPGGEEHLLESEPVGDGSVYVKGHEGETYRIQSVHDDNGTSYPVQGVVVDGQKYENKLPYEWTTVRIEIEHPGSFPDSGSSQAATV